MRNFLTAIVFGLAAVVLIALPASAAGPYGLSFSGAGIPIVSGDAANADAVLDAPKYQDAFGTGWGARIEAFYDFSPTLRGQFGVTYQSWGGEETFPGLQFDDLKMWAIYIGGKYRFLPGSKFRPYLVADVGYASLDSVNLSAGGTSIPYWDKTGTYLVDAGLGAEYMVTPNLGIFVDVRGQMFGKPDELITPTAEADPGISVPISVGVNFNF